ncbi:hypothetical protein COO60DRAFT_964515 [Scenedesmus sp. NREL 46B-D3]|nr:hypothetical protein COO60DRAFT_964515 [Scenedesmus sp. NREL 46B-D3]
MHAKAQHLLLKGPLSVRHTHMCHSRHAHVALCALLLQVALPVVVLQLRSIIATCQTLITPPCLMAVQLAALGIGSTSGAASMQNLAEGSRTDGTSLCGPCTMKYFSTAHAALGVRPQRQAATLLWPIHTNHIDWQTCCNRPDSEKYMQPCPLPLPENCCAMQPPNAKQPACRSMRPALHHEQSFLFMTAPWGQPTHQHAMCAAISQAACGLPICSKCQPELSIPACNMKRQLWPPRIIIYMRSSTRHEMQAQPASYIPPMLLQARAKQMK